MLHPCMPGWLPRPVLGFDKPLLKEVLMKFEDLGLAEPLLRAVRAQGYPTTTKIQAAAIPPVLEGRDVLGCAQTGTGKTAAFALPTLQRLSRAECRVNGRGRKIRTLVLAPTRELALQICESFQAYGRYTDRAASRDLRRRRPVAASPGLERTASTS